MKKATKPVEPRRHALRDVAILCFYADGHPDALAEMTSDLAIDTAKAVYLFIDSRTSVRKRISIRKVLSRAVPAEIPLQTRVIQSSQLGWLVHFYEWIPNIYKFQSPTTCVDATAALAQRVIQARCADLGALKRPTPWKTVAKRIGISPARLREIRQCAAFETALTDMAVAIYAYVDKPVERLRLNYTYFISRFSPLSGVRDAHVLGRIYDKVCSVMREQARESGDTELDKKDDVV